MTSVIAPPAGDAVAHPDRIAALDAVREFLAHDPQPVVDVLCEISNRQAVGYEIEATVATLEGATAEVGRHLPRRIGRLAAFMPSNVLLYSYALYLLVPSLFTDRLVFRPSGQVKDQTLRLHALLEKYHGLPIEPSTDSHRGFVRAHAAPSEVVVFTGAYENAEQVRKNLPAGRRLFLFFGSGVNPFVVAPGADLALAARDAVNARILNSGQDCLGPDLYCVHESLLDDFLAALIAEIRTLRYGAYTDPEADYGPMFYDGALEQAALFLSRNTRNIVHGGTVSLRDRHVEPTVVLGPEPGPRTQVPEFFAPVFNVCPYRDAQVLGGTLTTGHFTERSLGASVYGDAPDLVRTLRRRATVTVDASLLSIDDGNAPFGGYGRMANYITDGTHVWCEPVLVSKAVAERLPVVLP